MHGCTTRSHSHTCNMIRRMHCKSIWRWSEWVSEWAIVFMGWMLNCFWCLWYNITHSTSVDRRTAQNTRPHNKSRDDKITIDARIINRENAFDERIVDYLFISLDICFAFQFAYQLALFWLPCYVNYTNLICCLSILFAALARDLIV